MSENARLEYQIASESVRHYDNLFFAHLTVFITATAGLAAVAFQAISADVPVSLFAKCIGWIFTGTAWINATIYLARAYQFLDRIIVLEKELGLKAFSGLIEHRVSFFSRHRWLRPGGLSWHLLYAAVAVFWTVVIARHILCAA